MTQATRNRIMKWAREFAHDMSDIRDMGDLEAIADDASAEVRDLYGDKGAQLFCDAFFGAIDHEERGL